MTECSRPLALDSTKLLSADSYLSRLLGQVGRDAPLDPNSRPDLVESLAVYLDGRPVFHPLPKAEVDDPTPLLGMWHRRRDEPLFLRPIDLDPQPVARALATDFRTLVRDRGSEVAEWIRFQFRDDQMARIYWQGGNTHEDLLLALDRTYDLRIDDEGRGFRDRLETTRFSIPREHLAQLAHPKLKPLNDDPTLFALSYAFHAFRKGYLYALRLSDEGVAYWSHWLRERAIAGSLRSQVSKAPDEVLLNMGEVLVGLLERRALEVSEVGALEDLLSQMRERLAIAGGVEAFRSSYKQDHKKLILQIVGGHDSTSAAAVSSITARGLRQFLKIPCDLLSLIVPSAWNRGEPVNESHSLALLRDRLLPEGQIA